MKSRLLALLFVPMLACGISSCGGQPEEGGTPPAYNVDINVRRDSTRAPGMQMGPDTSMHR